MLGISVEDLRSLGKFVCFIYDLQSVGGMCGIYENNKNCE